MVRKQLLTEWLSMLMLFPKAVLTGQPLFEAMLSGNGPLSPLLGAESLTC